MRALALAAALAVTACAPAAPLPPSPIPVQASIRVDAQPVPLDPDDAGRQRLGDFAYAGGVWLTSSQTSRLHGLSDLKVWADGRVLIQGDEADQVEGHLVFDARGRLTGLKDVRIRALKGADGQELYAKGSRERDAEGIAELPDGDRLVSFEQHDRVLLYPARGGPPREVPKPAIGYVYNKGIEGLDLDPDAGPDAYLVGVEATGQTFVCRLAGACVADRGTELSDGFELSGLKTLSGGRRAYLLRAFDPLRGPRIILRIVAADGAVLDELELARPLTVDNFEGVAALERPDGSIRFLLVSDDNFGTYSGLPTGQRTLLLAFDWRPKAGRKP